MLRRDDYDEWLHGRDIEAARRMLNLLPAADMTAGPIRHRPHAPELSLFRHPSFDWTGRM